MSAIIVFSPHAWDGSSQHSRQLFQHLARHWPVLFVEAPDFGGAQDGWESFTPATGVTVLRAWFDAAALERASDPFALLRPLLSPLLSSKYVAWYQTPAAAELLTDLDPVAVVYERLNAVRAGSQSLKAWTQQACILEEKADLVLAMDADGLSMSSNAFVSLCDSLPKAGHSASFVQVLDRTISHPAHKTIPGPRLGFLGPLDARVDVDLLAAVADARPNWQLVLLGAVRERKAGDWPRRANIHYMDGQQKAAWPQFLAGWQAGFLPYLPGSRIDVEQALTFMRAGLPLVSTSLTGLDAADAVALQCAQTVDAVVAACEDALTEGAVQRAARLEAMQHCLARHVWESRAERLRQWLEAHLAAPTSGLPGGPDLVPHRLETADASQACAPPAPAMAGKC